MTTSQCKEIFGNFSEDPDRFGDEFVKLNLTFTRTWQDAPVALAHCCTLQEKAQEGADSLVATSPQQDVIRAWGRRFQTQTLSGTTGTALAGLGQNILSPLYQRAELSQ